MTESPTIEEIHEHYADTIAHQQSTIDAQRAEIAALKELADYAEAIICNALPMSHTSQPEWDRIVTKWRDLKHGKFLTANEVRK